MLLDYELLQLITKSA